LQFSAATNITVAIVLAPLLRDVIHLMGAADIRNSSAYSNAIKYVQGVPPDMSISISAE
jgi:hypothetical protein